MRNHLPPQRITRQTPRAAFGNEILGAADGTRAAGAPGTRWSTEQPELIAALERHGIEVLPTRQVLGGGFHCVTPDIARDGGPEDYLT
jgi:hypothetical protein